MSRVVWVGFLVSVFQRELCRPSHALQSPYMYTIFDCCRQSFNIEIRHDGIIKKENYYYYYL